MAREYATVVGSGCSSQLQEVPDLVPNFPPGRYPIPSQRDKLRTRIGDGVVVLNFEDASVFIGLDNQSITIPGGTGTPLPQTPLVNRRALVIHNIGPDIAYLGKSTVSSSDGLPLLLNEKIAINCQGNDGVTIWAVSAGVSDLRILELS